MQEMSRRIEESWFYASALERPQDELTQKVWGAAYDALDSVKGALVIIFVLFTFLLRIVGVEGPSMQPTLQDGNWLTISPAHSAPKRGDIVVVTQPKFMQEPLIKRVIGVGGDEIDIDIDAKTVSVNGKVLSEPYISGAMNAFFLYGQQYPKTVPQGYLFVMGDNRNNSSDSRSPAVGMIDERYVLGAVSFRLFPMGGLEKYPNPEE